MRRLALVLVVLVLAGGCVTPGDLARVSDLVVQFGEDLEDESKSLEEVKASARETAEQIEDVAAGAIERAEKGLTLAQGSGVAGVATAVGTLLLNAYRNRTRERRLGGDRRAVPRDGPDRRAETSAGS